MTDRWIVIPRWDEFQHRDMARSSVPPWIKTYTRLLHDDAYLGLTSHQRAVLHGLWLAYASARRQLLLSTSSLSSHLRLRVMTRDIEALNHAGFITFSASKPASNLASLEVEVEVEKKDLALKDVTSNGHTRDHRPYDKPTDSLAHIRRLIANGVIADLTDLDVELRSGDHHLDDHTIEALRALLTNAERSAA